MSDSEILQMILMKLEKQEASIDTLKEGYARMASTLEKQEESIGEVKENYAKMAVTLENDVQTKLNLLGEGQVSLRHQLSEEVKGIRKDLRDLEDVVIRSSGKVLDVEERVQLVEEQLEEHLKAANQ